RGGGEGLVGRDGQVAGRIVGLDAIVIGRAGGQTAQAGAVAGDQGRVERGAAAIRRGGAILDLSIGGLIGGPADAGASSSDAAGSHVRLDWRRDIYSGRGKRQVATAQQIAIGVPRGDLIVIGRAGEESRQRKAAASGEAGIRLKRAVTGGRAIYDLIGRILIRIPTNCGAGAG